MFGSKEIVSMFDFKRNSEDDRQPVSKACNILYLYYNHNISTKIYNANKKTNNLSLSNKNIKNNCPCRKLPS